MIPRAKRYEMVSTSPTPLQVTRGSDTVGAVSGLSGVDRQILTRQGTDINFIKLSDRDLQPTAGPVYLPRGFISWPPCLCF